MIQPPVQYKQGQPYSHLGIVQLIHTEGGGGSETPRHFKRNTVVGPKKSKSKMGSKYCNSLDVKSHGVSELYNYSSIVQNHLQDEGPLGVNRVKITLPTTTASAKPCSLITGIMTHMTYIYIPGAPNLDSSYSWYSLLLV